MAELKIPLANRDGASFRVDRRMPLLDALEAQGMSLPYGCRYGGGGSSSPATLSRGDGKPGGATSWAANLLSGEIDQRAGVALNGRQLADGYVLLCVARPLTDCTLDVGVGGPARVQRHPLRSRA